jgi:NTP pyrophosphatase (non-canonical NTP hydrolase)
MIRKQTMEETEELVLQWAEDRGLIRNTTAEAQALKLVEEIGELCRAVLRQDTEEIIDGVGDAMVVMTNLVERLQLGGLGHCYRTAYLEIQKRTGKMVNGAFVKDQT